MSTVLATVGTIPGAGTTTVVTALGAALGEQRSRVALVDATAEGSRIGDVLSLSGGGELTDALRRGAAIGDVQATGPHDIAVFPASADTAWGSVRPDAVADTYDALRERFDYVVVDCGSGLTPASAAWLGHADEVLVVTDPDVAGTIDETAALARAFDVELRGIVANRVPMPEVEEALEALEATDLPVLAVLPEDPAVGSAEAAGESVLAHDPDSPIATVVWSFAMAIRERDHAQPAVPRGTVPGRSPVPRATTECDGDADSGPASETAEAADDEEAAPPAEATAAASGGSGQAATTREAEESAGDAAESTGPEADAAEGIAEEHPTGTAVGAPEDGPNRSSAADADADGVDATNIDLDLDVASSGESASSQTSSGPAGSDAQSGTADAAASDGATSSVGNTTDTTTDNAAEETFEFDTAARPSSERAVPDESDSASATEETADASTPDTRSTSETDDADPEPPDDDHSGGSATDPDPAADDEDAELSDEEIEAVFKETMERVQERREGEKD